MIHTRHAGIFSATGLTVTLVGAGGIGAMTALMLAKMGISELLIYDEDTVSQENMPTQLHRLQDLDRPKVFGLEETILTFSDDTRVYSYPERITADMSLYGKIVVSGVDSIQARQDIWQAVCSGAVDWYIDARMSAEEFQMYVVDLTNLENAGKYDRMVMGEDDSRIAEIPCTEKATFYCSAMAAAHVGCTVRKILTGVRPAYYTVHNMLHNKLITLGEA